MFVLLLLLISVSCNIDNEKQAYAHFNKTYNESNVPSQIYYIDNSIDNIIKGKKGTRILVEKNSFRFKNKEKNVDSIQVKLEIKEVLTKADIVLGNCTTITDKNEYLETGGMLYVKASSKNNELILRENKALKISLPTDSLLNEMSVYEGERDSIDRKMAWTNPQMLIENSSADSSIQLINFEKSHNIRYSVEPFGNDTTKYPIEVIREVGRIAWRGTGLKILKDSVLIINGYTVDFIKQDTLTKWSHVFKVEKGQNSYLSDLKVNYIFELKNLGWANIDRLLNDPRTEEIELLVKVNEENKFNYVFTNLITQKMYLPGYQKKDNTFAFTHGDYEKTRLPIGEEAVIISTAYKNEEIYFGYKKFKISAKESLELDLRKVSESEIKEIIEKEI